MWNLCLFLTAYYKANCTDDENIPWSKYPVEKNKKCKAVVCIISFERRQSRDRTSNNEPFVSSPHNILVGNCITRISHLDILTKCLTLWRRLTAISQESYGLNSDQQLFKSIQYPKFMTQTIHVKCMKTTKRRESCLGHKNKTILHLSTQIDDLNSSSNTVDDEESSSVCLTKRRVKFGSIRFCEHPILIGDNPGGNKGPPLTIDWYAQEIYEMNMEEYEGQRPQRRNKSQLFLPERDRKDILKKCGYSHNEIIEQTRPVNIARQHRKATIQAAKLDGIQELLEKVSRKTFNAMSFGRRKRQERKFVQRCRCFDSTEFSSRSTLATVSDGGSHMDSFTGHIQDDGH